MIQVAPDEQLGSQVARFREVCRAAGLKLTPQRLAIFKIVASSREHPAVDEVLAGLREQMPGLSPDTVYRTLATFEKLGLVCRVQELCDRARFDAGTHAHGHFLCTECGSIADFPLPTEIVASIPDLARGAGECRGVSVQIRGRCARCMERGKEAPKSVPLRDAGEIRA